VLDLHKHCLCRMILDELGTSLPFQISKFDGSEFT
jgi:hypothetical protein